MPSSNLYPADLGYCHCCSSYAHVLVHQPPYVSRQGGSMDEFEATTIIFRKGGKCGIPVGDGISGNCNGLERRDSRPFEGVNVTDLPRVMIEWPGYPPWTGNFRTRDTTPAKNLVTLSWLAKNLCRVIAKFIEEMSGRECADARWKVGPGHLEVKDLILLSLQRASLGTWVMSIEVPLRLGGNGVAGIQG